jgi:hypothetical protein
MRALVIALLTAALAAPSAGVAGQVRVGARGGLNRASVEEETGRRPTESLTGLFGGAYVEGGLFGRFGWQVGGHYSQKGIREVAVVEQQSLELEWAVDYVEMPLMVQYLAQAAGSVALVLYGGGAPAFKVGCDSTLSLGNESLSAACGDTFPGTPAEVQQVKSFDVNGIVGGSVTAILGSVQISGEVFYALGLIPFVDEDDPGEPDLKHRVTTFALGVSIPLGGGPPDLLEPF